MTPLCELAAQFKTDKYKPHNYTPFYYRLFKDRIESTKRVLEIGIRTGASLRMWEEFFPRALIFGIDKNMAFLGLNEGRISSHWGNQGKPEKLANVLKRLGGNFDIIVDDGNHHPERQILAMGACLPFLKPDGLYFIEDIRADDDVTAIQSHIPRDLRSYVYNGGKVHPKLGPEKMLIIWNPDNTTPDLADVS